MENKRVFGMLGIAAKAGKTISGADACIEAIGKNKIIILIVSEDASEKTKKNFMFYAEKYNIPIYIYGTIEEISKSIGKKNKAIIGIKDKSLANAIEKIINGGDVIGQNKNT